MSREARCHHATGQHCTACQTRRWTKKPAQRAHAAGVHRKFWKVPPMLSWSLGARHRGEGGLRKLSGYGGCVLTVVMALWRPTGLKMARAFHQMCSRPAAHRKRRGHAELSRSCVCASPDRRVNGCCSPSRGDPPAQGHVELSPATTLLEGWVRGPQSPLSAFVGK